MREFCHSAWLRLRLRTAPAKLFAHLYHLPFYGGLLRGWAASLPVSPPARVAEAGCGPGALARHLAEAGFRVTGCDISPAMIAMAQSRHGGGVLPPGSLGFRHCPDGDLADGSEGYDAVIAASVINATKDPAALLRAMCRAAKPGGLLALLYPLPSMTQDAAAQYCRRHRLTPGEAAALKLWAGKAPKMATARISALIGEINTEAPEGTPLQIEKADETLLDGMVATCILRKRDQGTGFANRPLASTALRSP